MRIMRYFYSVGLVFLYVLYLPNEVLAVHEWDGLDLSRGLRRRFHMGFSNRSPWFQLAATFVAIRLPTRGS